jgi:hypothetical protein
MKYPIPSGLGNVQPGDIGNMHTNTVFGWLMDHSPQGRKYRKLTGDKVGKCPSHSVMFVQDGDGKLCVGDVTVPICFWMPLADFAGKIESGLYSNVRLFRVTGSTPDQRSLAAKRWNEDVHNSPYDIWAYPKLVAQVLFGWRFTTEDGFSFAHYCTEANEEEWNSIIPGTYPINSTPVTEIELWMKGILEEIS